MLRLRPAAALSCGILGLAAVAVAPALAITEGDWTSYRNARHGFMIAWPSRVFKPDPERESEDGRALVTADGRARLLVGAFENAEQTSLKQYRDFLLSETYAGAALDYAPERDKWFVLSGVRNGSMFYERVTFTCGGRIINSWAMVYPTEERRTYDRIVETVARSYAPGAGARGTCD